SPSPPTTPQQPLPAVCLHYFDMVYSEDIAWTTKDMGDPSQSSARGGQGEAQKEPEQCPIIDSQGLGLGAEGDLQASLPLEEHSLEQVQSMVVGEVLKDIETACKLLNIAAGQSPAMCRSGSYGQSTSTGYRRSGSPSRSCRERTCVPCPRSSSASALPPVVTSCMPTSTSGSLVARFPSSSSHPSLSTAGGDAGWADSEVDSSCAGQPIHLWQFLKELLLKPHNYGRFIRWLNKEKGIFKIEDSAQVARLWGIRKNRPAMNYDKLSRSIRQYYKKGIIRKPDISQRLVYQFVHPV
ncbi:SPDEF factor, partial [Eolophus roseicapillus]|nr:SPDEF factor [Eolophus roseicapilla]